MANDLAPAENDRFPAYLFCVAILVAPLFRIVFRQLVRIVRSAAMRLRARYFRRRRLATEVDSPAIAHYSMSTGRLALGGPPCRLLVSFFYMRSVLLYTTLN